MAGTKKQIGYMLESAQNIRAKMRELDKAAAQLEVALEAVFRNMPDVVEAAAPKHHAGMVETIALPAVAEPVLWYGVSVGNGNDGVSRTLPRYFVKTNEPYLLAEAGMLCNLAKPLWPRMAEEIATAGDDPKWGVSATLYEGPDGETEFGAAWLICEVWLADEDTFEHGRPSGDIPSYDNPESCFDADLLKLIRDV